MCCARSWSASGATTTPVRARPRASSCAAAPRHGGWFTASGIGHRSAMRHGRAQRAVELNDLKDARSTSWQLQEAGRAGELAAAVTAWRDGLGAVFELGDVDELEDVRPLLESLSA